MHLCGQRGVHVDWRNGPDTASLPMDVVFFWRERNIRKNKSCVCCDRHISVPKNGEFDNLLEQIEPKKRRQRETFPGKVREGLFVREAQA